ncbi:mitochondrial 54S ribosomal protein mrpl1 [Cyanidiococcus yangmingshanensis]|uniref:Large ribosomal subunit protein uL1c n=1 Tax=Cyanidiococcus yangmingshanensis TaxID=2690220 RepID=A0A7J7IMN3_9RHOD|nr:mitochondrial 54S ribosomal protein mrpl1 [Cyanidiococcus yangmingshanensis]
MNGAPWCFNWACRLGSLADTVRGRFVSALFSTRALRTTAVAVDKSTPTLSEAIEACLAGARKRFDETIDLCVRLNLDPRKPDHNLRGLVRLPAGVPRAPRADDARARGAHLVGAEELVEHIQEHGVTFERCLATPEAMPYVSRVARVLGPRGLVPSEKLGTVGVGIGALVEAAQNSVHFRTDPFGQIHLPVAKVSFGPERVRINVLAVVHHLLSLRPESVRRRYLLGATLSRTQGPGIEIGAASLAER